MQSNVNRGEIIMFDLRLCEFWTHSVAAQRYNVTLPRSLLATMLCMEYTNNATTTMYKYILNNEKPRCKQMVDSIDINHGANKQLNKQKRIFLFLCNFL